MYLTHCNIRLLLTSLFLLTINLAYSQIEKPFKNDWARDELKGKVKQIEHYIDEKLVKKNTYNSFGFQTTYQLYTQSIPQKIASSYESLYDTVGNLIKVIDANFSALNKYDDRGNLIENRNVVNGTNKTYSLLTFQFKEQQIINSQRVSFVLYSDEVDYVYNTEYSYNQKKLLIGEFVTYTQAKETVLKQKIFYDYDSLERRISKTEFNVRGDTTLRIEYDIVGRITARLTRFPSKTQPTSTSDYNTYYKYDDKGNRVEISEYSTKGILIYKDDYKFDANRNCISNSHYSKDNLTGEIQYVYDANGWLTEEFTYSLGELKKTVKYTRDNIGNIIKATHFYGKQNQILVLEYHLIYYD